MAPFAQEALRRARQNDQVLLLSLDQTDLSDRMAVLMMTMRVGDRSLPLAWLAEEGAANIGFAQQKRVLERLLACLPEAVKVMRLADRFYPSVGLLQWVKTPGWRYRLHLNGKLLAEPGPNGMPG
jgi:hypothetical protein